MSQVKEALKIVILTVFALLSFFLILEFIKEVPFLLIFLEIFFILISIAINNRTQLNLRTFTLTLGVPVLMIAAFEAFFTYKDFVSRYELPRPAYSGKYMRYDDRLRGYSAFSGAKVRAKEIKNGRVIYDVAYTTNKYGLRISPHDINPAVFKPDFKDVIFFGCSFTFGEGVADNESLPFVFEEKSQGKYKAYNFGFHGYGPQQMFRILESGMLDTVGSGRQAPIAIYQFIGDHISRCSFKYPAILWYKGPVCKLDKSGNIVSIDFAEQSLIDKELLKSHLFRRALYRVRADDIKLAARIIQKSKEIFENKYKGEFYVVCWDNGNPLIKDALEELQKENIKVFLISRILGNLREDEGLREKYIIKGGTHPNGAAYEAIAEYLLNNIGPNK